MRHIILGFLAFMIFLGVTFRETSVGAVSRVVSGEKKITTPVLPKPVLKIKLTDTQKKKLLEMKEKLMAEIKTLEASIANYDAMIYDIKAKIDARIKAGIKDNIDLKEKLYALMKARTAAKKELINLKAKLSYVEAKLK